MSKGNWAHRTSDSNGKRVVCGNLFLDDLHTTEIYIKKKNVWDQEIVFSEDCVEIVHLIDKNYYSMLAARIMAEGVNGRTLVSYGTNGCVRAIKFGVREYRSWGTNVYKKRH